MFKKGVSVQLAIQEIEILSYNIASNSFEVKPKVIGITNSISPYTRFDLSAHLFGIEKPDLETHKEYRLGGRSYSRTIKYSSNEFIHKVWDPTEQGWVFSHSELIDTHVPNQMIGNTIEGRDIRGKVWVSTDSYSILYNEEHIFTLKNYLLKLL